MRRVIVFFGEFLYGSLKVWVDGAEKSVAFGQGPDSVVRGGALVERALAAEAPLVLFVGDSTARLLYVAFVHVHVH